MMQADNSSTGTRDAPLQLNEDAGDGFVWNRAWLVLLGLAALLCVAFRLWRFTDSCLWFDEIFSVHAARHDWNALLRFVAQDVIHPPLFYILLKAWMMSGGESLAWLRLFPALISVATIVPFVSLCRALRLKASETTLALMLMAFNGYLIKYAQELRMYSLLLFFACCSLRLFVGYYNARAGLKRHLAALFFVNLLLVYTHYYGWLVVVSELAFLILFAARLKLRLFFITAMALVVGFSPWAYLVVRAAAASEGLRQNIGWMTRPGLRAVIQFYVTLNELLYYPQSNNEPLFSRWSAPLGLLLCGAPAAALIIRHALNLRAGRATHREREATTRAAGLTHDDSPQMRDDIAAARGQTMHHDIAATAPGFSIARVLRWSLLFFALPLALAFFASWLLPYSTWGARHLIIVAPAYLILLAIAINRLRPVWMRSAVLMVLACWAIVSASVLAMRSDGDYIWCAWEPLARQAAEVEGGRNQPVKIYAFEDLVAYHAWFALSSMKAGEFEVGVVKGIEGLREDTAYFLPRGFGDVKTLNGAEAFAEEHFWIAFRDTAWKPESEPLRTLRARGLETGQGFALTAQGNTAFLVPVRRRQNH